ncbi:MAG: glycosyltransferase [Sedimentisphaerales bacterium]|nr:glycosyltransferase [Sedimentisphaerales bacterium]
MERIVRRICVVLVIDDLAYGGAERQVVELANNLNPARFDAHVCSLSDHVPLSDTLRDAEHRLHTVIRKSRFDFTVVPRLAFLLRTLKADIVHGYLFSAEIICRLAGRIARTSLVIGSERNANRSIRKDHIIGLKLTRRCVDIIVANSNAGAESNRKVFDRPASDYRVVHNGIDAARFKPADARVIRDELAIPTRCPVIGAFANFKKQKNHAMLFRAFRLVLDSVPDARLLLVGEQPVDSRGKLDGYQAQLDRLVDDLGIRHRCMFLGHRGDVEHVYPACNVTVLSSLHEGTPNVLLESMACGVPVVATNVCDNEYIVRDGEVGHLVAVGDEVGMAHRIESLLRNDILRQEMGQKARHWVVEEFSSKRMTDKMEDVYLEFLSKKYK